MGDAPTASVDEKKVFIEVVVAAAANVDVTMPHWRQGAACLPRFSLLVRRHQRVVRAVQLQ